MKKKFIFLGLISAIYLFVIGCQKEEPTTESPTPYYGEGAVLMNDKPLKLECYTIASPDYEGKFGMSLSHYNEEGYKRGGFNFRHFSLKKGVYYPSTFGLEYKYGTPADTLFTVSYYTNQSDGDVIGDRYILQYDSAGVFTIDSINQPTGELWGTFEIKMVKDTTTFGEELDKNAPYEISFKSGEFYAIVRE